MAENWTITTSVIPDGTTSNWTTSSVSFEPNKTSFGSVTATPTIASPPVATLVLRLFYSRLEQALFSLYLWLNVLLSLAFNVLVLTIIGREPRLHTPENLIIASDAINNIVHVLTGSVYTLVILQLDSTKPEYYSCQVSSYISAISFVLTTYLILIYSYERYNFLCHPITYAKRITKRRVAVAVVVALIISFVYLYSLSYPNRVFSVTVMMGSSRDVVKTIATGFACGALPAILMVVYSVINIKRLQQRSVVKSNDNTETKAAKEKQTKRQVSAIKTILLVSGTYCLLYFPFLFARLVVYRTVSALDLETRRYPAVTLLVRCAWLAMGTTTQLLNPILYLSTRKKLKAGLFVMLPWLHDLRCIRIKKIEVAAATNFTAS